MNGHALLVTLWTLAILATVIWLGTSASRPTIPPIDSDDVIHFDLDHIDQLLRRLD